MKPGGRQLTRAEQKFLPARCGITSHCWPIGGSGWCECEKFFAYKLHDGGMVIATASETWVLSSYIEHKLNQP